MPIFLKFQAWKKIHIIFFLVLAYSISCDARIVKIVIDEVKPLPSADGGGIDTEQIAGRAFGEIDPNQKQNAIINDINLVKDKDGKVRYVATFVITKPVDAKNASGLMWHEVPNRGLKRPNVDYDRFENAYKLINPDDSYELPGLMFTQKELLALLSIQNMISELEPGLLGPRLMPLQERLSEILEKEGIDAKALTKRVRAVHAGKRRLELKNFQVVAQATFERKRLHIEHYNRGRDEHTHRDISPQQLVHYRDNWYVDAWCHTREKILNFSVDVITECKVLDVAAKEVSQKDIKQAMQSGYGIFGGEAKNWAKLKFTPERARWVQAEEWHPEQKTTQHKDGSYTLEIPYSDDRELLGDILLFGPDVEVVGPTVLRDKLITAVRKTLDKYEHQ